MMKKSFAAGVLLGILVAITSVVGFREISVDRTGQEPLNAVTRSEIQAIYRQLIDAENRHDLDAVRPFVWTSPSTLFVAKTKTAAEGNWAGFWGTDVVMRHLGDLYQGPFRIDPDYAQVKVVGLTHDVAELYAPVKITVAYGGQIPVPKPFLIILVWNRTPDGWKMATDIALPVPPDPAAPEEIAK